MFRKITFIFLAISLWISNVYAKELEICVYTSDMTHTMETKIAPLAEYLQNKLSEKKIDIKINFKVYPTYKEAIESLVKGKCSIARFGPASYIIAKKAEENIKIIAIEQKKGKKINYGHFIVHESSKIKSLDDIRGKSIAFGNELSTIGRYLAQNELLLHKIKAESLKSYEYLGRHDQVALRVYTKRFDVGVVKDGTLEKYKVKKLKKINTFKSISKPWIAAANMDKKTFRKIQKIFLKISDENVLKGLKNDGFVRGKDSEYNFVRKAIKNSKKFDKK